MQKMRISGIALRKVHDAIAPIRPRRLPMASSASP